jgi:hypothetical protein
MVLDSSAEVGQPTHHQHKGRRAAAVLADLPAGQREVLLLHAWGDLDGAGMPARSTCRLVSCPALGGALSVAQTRV